MGKKTNLGFLVISLTSSVQQSFDDDLLRAKSHLLMESRRGNTGRESASAKRGAGLEVEAALADRELHEHDL